jgi:hypothetical protein
LVEVIDSLNAAEREPSTIAELDRFCYIQIAYVGLDEEPEDGEHESEQHKQYPETPENQPGRKTEGNLTHRIKDNGQAEQFRRRTGVSDVRAVGIPSTCTGDGHEEHNDEETHRVHIPNIEAKAPKRHLSGGVLRHALLVVVPNSTPANN